MEYKELKAKHQSEVNSFDGIFFAFNKGQFSEGIKKVGASKDNKITRLGSGRYVLKNRIEAFCEMLNRHKAELKEFKKDRDNLIKSIAYELGNHEYKYTGNACDALSALGLTIEKVPKDILQKAKKLYYSNDQNH